MDSQVLAALIGLVLCGGLGVLVPRLIAVVPEPEPDPEPEVEEVRDPEDDKLFSTTLPPAPPKIPYAEIAAAPGLAAKTAVGSAVVGALVGWGVGLHGALVYLVPLVPICAALLVIDWRVQLLPTWIMHRTYLLMAVLVPVAALVDQDLSSLIRAAWGWLVLGGWFWGFWFVTRGGGWGFGDVRLSRVLGPALGFLGWYELVSGLFLIVLVGGVGAIGSALVSRTLRQRIPYGPYMLVGALLAVVVGQPLMKALGY